MIYFNLKYPSYSIIPPKAFINRNLSDRRSFLMALGLLKHVETLDMFVTNTTQYISKSSEPGGYYTATWMRDASYILKDQFISGYIPQTIEELSFIWSNQIEYNTSRLICGRGSPSNNFTPIRCDPKSIKKYYGALPTTIYSSFSEIYATEPDIDSTALMIYTTSWILSHIYKHINSIKNDSFDIKPLNHESYLKTEFSKLTVELIPKIFKAIDYLVTKDIDNDGILEQNPNEDWMDTALRDGKIVYSQACWILALKSFVVLLNSLEKYEDAKKLDRIAQNSIASIEKQLWSDKQECYVDKIGDNETYYVENMVTQDSLLYPFALVNDNFLTESNLLYNSDATEFNKWCTISKENLLKCNKMLHSVKRKIWNRIPTITEKPLLKTGPYIHKPYNYHNHTFWPWITGIELMTRIRFNQIDECEKMISKLFLSNSNNDNLLFEWVNPLTHVGYGAYPFRTGISSLRLVIFDIFRILGVKIGEIRTN